MNVHIYPSAVSGSVQVPASKSLCHRALICAALAQGCSEVSNIGLSKDIEATLGCLQALGAVAAEVPSENGLKTLRVQGCSPSKRSAPAALDANESGSTLRFLIPIAASSPAETVFYGRPSLLVRPLGLYETIFHEQGLPFEQSASALRFHGPLESGCYTLEGNISSQFISGLLLAAPLLGSIELAVRPPYQSRSYVDLTLSMMEAFGIRIEQPDELTYRIAPGQNYLPRKIAVESDWSQAAFFLVLGMLQSPLVLSGLARNSLQGDAVIASMIEQAGGRLAWSESGLEVFPDQLRPFVFDLADCPDLGPILCTLGALIPGRNRLIHAARLRYKECDRINAMETELRKWGVEISSDEDSITISGQPAQVFHRTEPVRVDGHNDHRIVMAMAVFALCTDSECIIEGAQAVEKSYPGFFEDLRALGVRVEECEV